MKMMITLLWTLLIWTLILCPLMNFLSQCGQGIEGVDGLEVGLEGVDFWGVRDTTLILEAQTLIKYVVKKGIVKDDIVKNNIKKMS